MTEICDNLRRIRDEIHALEDRFGRPRGSVQLLAVSKTKPPEALREALACGQRAFGENYVQELEDKYAALAGSGVEWHFIGPLQANKSRIVAERADWMHSLDRVKIARRLSEQRPVDAAPLNVCLQVNISGEASKSGVTPDALPALAETVAGLPNLRLRGLMTIPAPSTDFDAQRWVFAGLREAQASLVDRGFALDTLSMGMTGDMAAAIAEGATIVRIGTAIFGARG
ncbi:MAG TPA: YggS family pyridoxal phosphate-dependent enzyme [Thioalkalivibrio sp.]|nr:YggS family pyridoxal phosphate-dependent enzyme [Thioalkalivibrio sp.]